MSIDETLDRITEQEIDELLADKIIESGDLEEGNDERMDKRKR